MRGFFFLRILKDITFCEDLILRIWPKFAKFAKSVMDEFTVCNFQSMKSPLELSSLFSKFLCYFTWFVISPDQTRLWTSYKRGLHVKSYCSSKQQLSGLKTTSCLTRFGSELGLYRNQSADLQCRSMDWFLYNRSIELKRVNSNLSLVVNVVY